MSTHGQLSFRQHINSVHQLLLQVTEQYAQRPFREGGWSRREILGHLIDSALNNHQRFVRVALDGHYEGPSYKQEDWVTIHGYGSMSWSVLLEYWRGQNELLCEVVERIPQERLDALCRVGESAPVTLRFLVEDYLVHLQHHVRQIVGGATVGEAERDKLEDA
ncbi:MAG: DinB family protein [Chloroflexi bacterium]|nr:DinB family protein [Chloroflexota bacterium]